MATAYPLTFSLASGTGVVVHKREADTYEFVLTPAGGAAHSFTYKENEYTKAEWDERLEFEELDALREFWTQTEEII